MAKKKGRPKTSSRTDGTVKMDVILIDKAKILAVARRVSLAELVSELIRGPLEREFAKEMKRLSSGDD
jgi:hypothetical protein